MKSDDKNLSKILKYIDSYWDKVILKSKYDKINHLFLRKVILHLPTKNKNPHILEVPYAALVPNISKYRYIFYWDSYFMFQGLLRTRHEWIIPEMVENFIYIFKKQHIIPNFSHPEALGRSQAPFLTSMIFMAYDVLQKDKRVSSRIKRLFVDKKNWLEKRIDIAKTEYWDVWQSGISVDHKHYNHYVQQYELNCYGDRDVHYPQHAEQESGWDMTSRFYNRCDDFLPVDLNCFLYKYELDFVKAAEILKDPDEKVYWEKLAEKRKQKIQKLMWNEKKGFFFDYDYVHRLQSPFLSLAGFVPLWAGVATEKQAASMVDKLSDFQAKYGLTITDKESLPSKAVGFKGLSKHYKFSVEESLKPKQWDYPNIWPPLVYMTVIGLMRYGYLDDAKRIMQTYLDSNLKAYEKYGALLEKMDGETGDMPPAYWYPTQLGFGWTNAVFYRFVKILEELKKN